jgi:low affinity Fe/Cu permease
MASDDKTEKGFHVFATHAANWVGAKWAFLLALLLITVWLFTGPFFHYSDRLPPLPASIS